MTESGYFIMAKLYNSLFDSYHSHHGHSENCYAEKKEVEEEKKASFVHDKAQRGDTVSFQHLYMNNTNEGGGDARNTSISRPGAHSTGGVIVIVTGSP